MEATFEAYVGEELAFTFTDVSFHIAREPARIYTLGSKMPTKKTIGGKFTVLTICNRDPGDGDLTFHLKAMDEDQDWAGMKMGNVEVWNDDSEIVLLKDLKVGQTYHISAKGLAPWEKLKD